MDGRTGFAAAIWYGWLMLGEGLAKGLWVTARNFIGSYLSEERLVTVQYPEERRSLPEATRSFPFLVYDGDDPVTGLRCVACKICEAECPPQCIYIVKDKVKKPDATGKLQNQPLIFDIDISVCMSCQICVEVCPFDAIKMDVAYEWSTLDRFEGLLLHKEQLSKPNSYYHKIHPAEAAEVDARLAAARARAAAKSSGSSARPVGVGAATPGSAAARPGAATE
ncbi:MAG: 4Fe-4S dicluster domain-containing protein [Verrucomicrobiota bacterium]|nr:4Fe-4S dicluster domain-containing protein [Limisphaera sp.]MDW8382159.1 4Fe-4S dicluster domain-containing protein [Verrucomicrobiota bacterium]